MPAYKAPLDDMRFLLEEAWCGGALQDLRGEDDALAPEVVRAVLQEAGRFCEQVLAPLNRPGDEAGCVFDDGAVSTPPGFRDAYAAFVAGGWPALAAPRAHGGQALPETLSVCVSEMLCGANLAFSIYAGLTRGACRAIDTHANETLKHIWLPAMVAGRVAGTMCLTEPQCGTDLGLLRTRAEPRAGGSYAVSGTKIFISAGEHDLTENIVHLVLARLPDAPAGTRGISLFLVPKVLPSRDGGSGARNGVRCARIEHKMGIRASATCEMVFEAATGWLVGEPHRGLRAMFTMMNGARLSVGLQGVGMAEAARQAASGYARERLQGRAPGGAREADKAADPLLVHPDVRRMLLTMRAYAEGGRALVQWTAREFDTAYHHADAATRQAADDLVSLLTPVVKAFLTDLGSEAANLALQVWGGHGYIRDNGVEQLVRDARICQIYEGANGIQALDLVGRKLPAHGGRLLRGFFHPVHAWLQAHAGDETLADLHAPLAKGFGRLQTATGWIAARGLAEPGEAAAAASEYLRLFGLVAMGYCWARMAETALARLDGGGALPASFYRAKAGTARFYMQRVLPQTGSLLSAIMAGGGTLAAFPDEAF